LKSERGMNLLEICMIEWVSIPTGASLATAVRFS